MRTFKGLLIGIVALAGVLLVVGFVLPDRARVERSIVVRATPGTVFAFLDGFRNVGSWSPWAALDASALHTFEGPAVGVGARWSWSSTMPSVGSGSQEIIESRPYEYLRMRLLFASTAAESHTSFRLTPEGAGTRITWDYETVFGDNLTDRYLGLLLDRLIGRQYEQGLQQLKARVEPLPSVTIPLEVVTVTSRPLLAISGEIPVEQVPQTLAAAYARIGTFMQRQGLQAAEPPLAITREFDDRQRRWSYTAAIVPDRADVVPPPASGIVAQRSYGGLAIRATYLGPHERLDDTYQQIIAYKRATGLEDAGPSWEQYVSDPATTAPADLKTQVYWAVE